MLIYTFNTWCSYKMSCKKIKIIKIILEGKKVEKTNKPNGSDNIFPVEPDWAFVKTTVWVVEPRTVQAVIPEGTAWIAFTWVVPVVPGSDTSKLVCWVFPNVAPLPDIDTEIGCDKPGIWT